MKKMFKSSLCLVILLFVFLCSACSTNEKIGGETNKNSKKSSATSTANTYKATLANNLNVDAIVNVVDVKDISILQIKERKFDEKKLCDIFLGTKDIKKDAKSSTYTTKDKELSVSEGNFHLITPLGDCVKSMIDWEPDTINKFKLKELDFMTKQKAIEQVTDVFKTLNITPHMPPKIYALDYKTLQQEEDRLVKNEDFKWFVDKGKIRVKEKWTKDDECYYMVFQIDINGIPCNPSGYTIQSSEMLVAGSKVEVIISKNGIELYNINGAIYTKENSKANASQLISMEQALDSLKKKYANVILTDPTTVTNISMIYIPVVINCSTNSSGAILNKQLEMVPAWYFNIEQKYNKNGKNGTNSFVVRINAITGKEIF